MEWFDIVDKNGNPTGKTVERERAHAEGIWHRTSHVWIARKQDGNVQLLLQKRSVCKDSFPGCYDISSAGHIPAGDGYEDSAIRELKEELGLIARKEDLICCGDRTIIWDESFHGKPFHERQYSRVFLLWADCIQGEMKLQPEEVEDVLWISFAECVEGVEKQTFPNCIVLEELLMVGESIGVQKRCKWCNLKNPLYVEYHDNEWGRFCNDDHYLLEMLILESFQAGLSWECVLNKREAFRKAYDGFDLEKICLYDKEKEEELAANPQIIRNRLKIKASIGNARIFKGIAQEYGSFWNYLNQFVQDKIIYEDHQVTNELSDEISKDLKKRGMKFVGSTIIYAYLQAIGVINSHDPECFLHVKEKLQTLFFSAAGTTAQLATTVADAMADSLNLDKAERKTYDITFPQNRNGEISFSSDDIVVIASPTYAGRIPNKIMPFFRDFVHGNGARCVLIVNYGNRNYDNSLRELYQLMSTNGFSVIGAGAFVSRHSMSKTLAKGRPDEEDLREASDFGRRVAEKIRNLPRDEQKIVISGDVGPYYTPMKEDGTKANFLKATPKVKSEVCDNAAGCNNAVICAKVCPMGSISKEDSSVMTGICIKCHACIRKCPANARFFDDEDLASHIRMLEANFSERRRNEIMEERQ